MPAPRLHVGQPAKGNPRSRFALTGVSQRYDPSLDAIRPDLADVAVAGTHFAPHYAAPMMRSCAVASVPLRKAADDAAEQVSELLLGEGFALLDVTGGWAWGYTLADHYVGYCPAAALGRPIAPSHRVAPRGTVQTRADGSTEALPGGALLMGDADGDRLITAAGHVPLADVIAADAATGDPVAVAEALVGTPYHWGGRSAAGIDCSGLVQRAFAEAGVALPRDSVQQAACGAPLAADAALARGDLVFFPGHVAIMVDAGQLIHASRHWQDVRVETLADVAARVAAKGHDVPVTGRRRIDLSAARRGGGA